MSRINGEPQVIGYCLFINGRCFHSAAAFLVVILTGCTVTEHPRARPGSYAASTIGVNFLDANSLGSHNYYTFFGESDGILYTCRGGHIDIAHLRIAADNVYYLYTKFSRQLKAEDKEFTYKLNTDPSVFTFHVTYPSNLKQRPQNEQDKIIHELSLELAQYGTWHMVTWHEVLTWFGLKFFYVVPQFQSAFSWEDSYSNLLGVILGARAICHPVNEFNTAMTLVLKEELEKLGVQPREVAYYASEKMRDKWFHGNIHATIQMRSLDIGADDGFVSPLLVPDICPQAQPLDYPVPNLDTAKRYGFQVELEIQSSDEATRRCLAIIYPDGNKCRLLPNAHLPKIMATIRQQAIEKGYQVTLENHVARINLRPKTL